MRKLLQTLYVTTPDIYLSLDGENVVAMQERRELKRLPLHNLEAISLFGYAGASPALMGACAKRGIALSFFSMNGRYLARSVGEMSGNVLLRREQYRIADDAEKALGYARNFILGKIYNARWVLERTVRDHALRVDADALKHASDFLQDSLASVRTCSSAERLLGLEGEAASVYFGAFDQMILQQRETFAFSCRSRRPPLDPVNAVLSFAYALLANDAASALEGVGLDSYVGFMHRDRSGRRSLALDLMEELRAVCADRFVLSLINRRQIKPDGFVRKESGAVLMDEETRRTILQQWQRRKEETIMHPYLGEKTAWGVVPHIQAQLLARCIRGDMEEYPPFLWK